MSKLSGTGENPEVLTVGCAEDSWARSWCPVLVLGATRKQNTCCPVAFGSSWSTMSRSLKCCWCATNLTVLRLLTMSPQRTTKPLWKEQPSWPSYHLSQSQAVQWRKWKDRLCTHCICVNKTLKSCQNKIKTPNPNLSLILDFHNISLPWRPQSYKVPATLDCGKVEIYAWFRVQAIKRSKVIISKTGSLIQAISVKGVES